MSSKRLSIGGTSTRTQHPARSAFVVREHELANSNFRFSLELLRSYCETRYWVSTCDVSFCLEIGRLHPRFISFLTTNQIENWAIITAENPRSRQLSDSENHTRWLRLRSEVRASGLEDFPTFAVAPSGNWPVEIGCFLPNVSPPQAVTLGQRFEQNAIVVGGQDTSPALIFCFPQEVRAILVQALDTELAAVAKRSLELLHE